MKRRDFVGVGLTAAATLSLAPGAEATPVSSRRTFTLKYAPHLGMFQHTAGTDAVAQIDYMAGEGFTAFEDNEMSGRPAAEQSRIGQALSRHSMTMGVFVAAKIGWSDPNLTSGDPAKREAFLADIRNSVEVAKRVNAKWMTVVPGLTDPRLEASYQTANLVESLKRAAAILEPQGLVMVLEPLNTLRDHPGQFLTRIPQAYLICKAVASPACKILFDMYHQQITEGNLIPNLDRAWDEVAYLQIGDNPGRKEPGTGEINYRNIFRHIREKGYRGVLGMEHGNSRPDKAGEQAVIDAYVAADS
jgi:hydroxypyruvate isomerase